MSRQSVVGQVVMITGAARGLGAGLAAELSARGAHVALVGLEEGELAARAAECGPGAHWWLADVTDEERLRTVAAEVVERWGRLDAVVANAGIATGGTMRMADARSFDRVIEVNLIGQARTARAVLPYLIASKGYYLQVSSLAAILPAPVMAAYCASKSGVEAMAGCLRGEVRHLGVGVGVAYLSWVDTDLVRGADEHPALRVTRAAMPWPLNRTYPLAPAVTALADGLERRRSRIMFPGWLSVLAATRGLAPGLTTVLGSRFARKAEREAALHPDDVVTEVGAGGAADRDAHP